jgi:hypothetical protein
VHALLPADVENLLAGHGEQVPVWHRLPAAHSVQLVHVDDPCGMYVLSGHEVQTPLTQREPTGHSEQLVHSVEVANPLLL